MFPQQKDVEPYFKAYRTLAKLINHSPMQVHSMGAIESLSYEFVAARKSSRIKNVMVSYIILFNTSNNPTFLQNPLFYRQWKDGVLIA